MLVPTLLAALAVVEPPMIPGEATTWVNDKSIPFSTPEAGHGFDDLQDLKAIVGEARIVSLGEPTHGTREVFQMKHRLLEFLATEMGFTIFSIEANMPESYELNQYILEGKGDPKKLIGGMYFWTWNTEEVLAMVEWMKDFNTTAKAKGTPVLQFTGFDMQTSAVAATIVKSAMATHLPDLREQVNAAYDMVERARFAGAAGEFGVATGSFPVEAVQGKKVTYSGWIRTLDLKDGFAGLWWRADGPTGVVAFDNMQGRGPTGTTDWTRYEISLDIPPETTNINFGAIMPGQGTAWFDDLEVQIDGEVYQDPAKFSFDFEDDAVRYLSSPTRTYKTKRSEDKPHGGKTCLEIRKLTDLPAGPPADPAEAQDRAAKILAALQQQRDALAAKTSPKEADWIVQNARVVAQCARMFGAGMTQGGSNVRDECMAENVEWILAQNPGAKIVLWAHNAHVSRGKMWGAQWMGSHLAKKFADKMVVFGFATGIGQYTAVKSEVGLSPDNPLEQPPLDSVESYLESAGIPRLILDIRPAKPGNPATGWLTEQRPMRGIGAMAMEQQFTPCVPKDLYDVLVYIDRTTSARQLDTKPGR